MKKLILAGLCFAATAPFACAAESYTDGFMKHWRGTFANQNSIVMLALGVGAAGVFIITRSKWKK